MIEIGNKYDENRELLIDLLVGRQVRVVSIPNRARCYFCRRSFSSMGMMVVREVTDIFGERVERYFIDNGCFTAITED